MEISQKPVSVVVADGQELVREAFAALCERTGHHQVVGQCCDGLAALRLIELKNPDVVLADLLLTGLHVHELISQARAKAPGVRFVVIAARQDRKTVLDTLRAGANAYIMRTGPASHFFDALQQVMEGGIYLSPIVAKEKVFAYERLETESDPMKQLSTREFQVFSLLVDGIRPKEIAARLDVSPKTVDSHRKTLMRKLDIHDVAGLVKLAIRRNLTSER